ncbi:MAG: KEOPS complex kinase/ATPase Bud32 [Thermoplasmata archaeon]|nr:KEOPS complex kinase/ATPase Bud32 [Thermoplasmata archaeon]
MAVLRRGAEAELHDGKWLDRDVIIKRRVPKGYRHPDLDSKIRAQRTKNETRLMVDARSKGISVPIIYDINLSSAEITMERIFGPRIKDLFNELPEEKAKELAYDIGKLAATLHSNDIVHGDLTTSNMLMREDGRICVIDFSLGEKTDSIEKKGVDLHLLFEAFHSAHYMREHLLKDVKTAYKEHYKEAEKIIQRVKEIEKRGRYT